MYDQECSGYKLSGKLIFKNKMRTAEINEALKNTISVKRLDRYLTVTDGALDKALKLYEENTRLAESFYSPLQSLEVCLRNTINTRLCTTYGEDWPTNGNPPFQSGASENITKTIAALEKDGYEANTDYIVAELNFGFWVSLLGKPYDATLWRHTLHKGFRASGSGKKRSEVHGRFNALRRLRNRVAHHEPIFHKPLLQLHTETIEAIGWMCKHTSAWAAHHSRFDEVSTTTGAETA